MLSVSEDGKAKHVLAVPYYMHGHITGMLRFTAQLARKGITVSFVCFEDLVPGLTSKFTSSELQTLDFRFVTAPSPIRNHPRAESIPRQERERLVKEAFEPLMEKLIHAKTAGIASPTCMISDIPWSLDVAEKLQIPRYWLITSGVAFTKYMQGCLDYFARGDFQISKTDGRLIEFDWPVRISGLPPLYYHDLNGGLREAPDQFTRRAESIMKSQGVIVNSFLELEEKAIQAFQNPDSGLEPIKVPKIYPVGPLFSTTDLTKSTGVSGLEDSSSKCLLWLSSQPSSSVLYVAFGTEVRLRPEQINELAYGLEASDQRFLWVLPQKMISSEEQRPSINEVLPQNFEARVGSRGCIVTGWAPQLQILAHSSTGGFMTHSGWNSSLESICFGVPMICWPHAAEQHLNCKYLVTNLKVAEQLQAGKENTIQRNEVERKVRLLMVEQEGAALRVRAQELKKTAAAAVAEGGSRSRIFREFLDDIRDDKLSRNSGTK